MTTERFDLLAICRRLLAWEQTMGGWDAPVWRDLRATLERTSDPPPTPVVGDRLLRLHIEGTLDIRIPDEIEEDGEAWDDWLDAAIQSALLDGRWQDCTGVDDSEVGILHESGAVRRV
ncbi:MAG: hypothetical protein C4558_09080 [Dehalococcoidia bacterium]|nr:MAG: hypothetical protein C4558_09080 [Dehalococcoidia bacterium]